MESIAFGYGVPFLEVGQRFFDYIYSYFFSPLFIPQVWVWCERMGKDSWEFWIGMEGWGSSKIF